MANLNGFDMPAVEDVKANRLSNSIDLFDRLWNNRWLKSVPFILALNKVDLLKEKLQDSQHSFAGEFLKIISQTFAPF